MASQWSQLRSLAAGVVRPQPERAPGLAHLTRDSFNTHKMLVVVTACGKVGPLGGSAQGGGGTDAGAGVSRHGLCAEGSGRMT